MKNKGVLLRKCIGCSEMKHKANLIRICRNVSNQIEIDETFKIDGRGAYICKDSLLCLEKSIKFNRIFRALKIEVPQKIITELKNKIRGN